MERESLAVIVFGALCLLALAMFLLERRAVARRKANGTFVDISDILFFGSEAATKGKPKD
jgi:hypothetical protein